MFSTFDIIHNSSEKVFNRGASIAELEGSVVFRSFTSGKQRCEISGDVRSSSGIAEHFHAYLATDPELQTIIDYECTCPAARKSSGLCKHCVALAITFKKDPASFDGFAEHDQVRTSFSLKEFISKAPKRSDLRIDAGSVRLLPTLVYDFGQWLLRLDIEAFDVKYVVSDMFEFATAVSDQAYFSYGKRLAFVHEPAAFDEVSLKIATLVVEKVRAGAVPRRELQLLDDDVVAFLDCLGSETFLFGNEAFDEEYSPTSIVYENPRITLRIIEADGDAYEIVRDDHMIVATSSDHSYVFMDGSAYRCTTDFGRCATFLKEVYCSQRDDTILLSKEDAPTFCANVLPTLEKSLSVSVPNSLDEIRPRDANFFFYLDKVGRGRSERIECRLAVDYGQGEMDLLAPASDVQTDDDASDGAPKKAAKDRYKDEAQEEAACALVFEYFDMTMSIPLDDEFAAGELLYTGLARFRQMGEIFTTPAFERLISDKKAAVHIGLSLSGDLIDMDIHSTDVSPEELAALLKSYRQKKKFHRLQDGSIASLDDMDLQYLDRMSSDLGLKPKDIAQGKVELPTYAAFILDREYSHAHRDASFQDYVDRFDDESLYEVTPPKKLKAKLREYQLEGLRWFAKLSSIGFGGILADEMGLGKTLQAIAYLLLMKGKEDGPALVVCPASLVYNWMEEVSKFAPSLKCVAVDGPKSQRRERRAEPKTDLMIASYDTVRMDADQFAEIEFSSVILDEAQFIKNHATKTTRAVKRLRAQHRFALTGTPIENRLSEIWSIFDFLMPGFLGTYAQFRMRFEIDILGGNDEVAAHFQALVSPFVLRRLKADVLKDLPEKQESVIYVPLEGEQRKLYDACEQNLRQDLLAQRKEAKGARTKSGRLYNRSQGIKVDVLAELMRLREVALEPSLVYSNYDSGSSKTAAVMELVDEAVRSNKKALVFSQFTSYLDILKKRLDEEGVAYYEITGATSKRTRVDLVNDFNENEVPVFLISLKAGGTGLNLIGASIVIHADPWWNAAAVEQATDRAHRIGQTEMVGVYKIIAKGTIEERILRLQEKKTDLAESVVAKNSLSSLSSLTREELESLLFD